MPASNFRLEFVSGDDFVLYLKTFSGRVAEWRVTIVGKLNTRVGAERVPTGEWLHPYYRLPEETAAWNVDEYLLKSDTPVAIEIASPDFSRHLVLPHPRIGGLFHWDGPHAYEVHPTGSIVLSL
jgi:hypothetical protein